MTRAETGTVNARTQLLEGTVAEIRKIVPDVEFTMRLLPLSLLLCCLGLTRLT